MNMPQRIAGLTGLLALALAAGCASTPPLPPVDPMADPVLVQLTSSAEAARAAGGYERAARFYTLALARARATDNGLAVAQQAYNTAACHLLAGRAADAQPLLVEAYGEFARARQDLGPVLLLQARAARQLGQANEAQAAISRVVEIARDQDVQVQAWLLHGQIACDAGQADEAGKALSRARHLLRDDPALRAGVASLAGRVAEVEGRPAEAALEYDKEAAWMQGARRYRDMAAALVRAGDALAKAGDARGAATRYYRGARSLHGQGDAAAAQRAIEQAVAVVPAEDAALAAQVETLRGEIRGQVGVAARPE